MPAFNSKEYGEVHQRLLQVFVSRGCIRGATELKEVFKTCLKLAGQDVEHLVNEPNIDIARLAVNTINTIMTHPKFKSSRLWIEKIVSEYDGGGMSYYVLVNRMNTPWTKGLSPQTETESELVKMTLTAITLSPDATISSVDFLNFVDDLKEKQWKIKKDDAQKLLDTLIKRQWLERKEGLIRMHPRGIAELKPYLQNVLNVQSCELCKELVMAVAQTECAECDSRVHQHCMKKYTSEGNSAKCPKAECGADWPHSSDAPHTSSNDEGGSRRRVTIED